MKKRRHRNELTEKERRFVNAMAKTEHVVSAAAAAGYSSPRSHGYRTLQIPRVMKALEAKRLARETLAGAMPGIVGKHVKMLEKASTAREFTPLAKLAYEAVGLTKAVPDVDVREAGEMTPAELARAIDELQARAAAKAKAVDAIAVEIPKFDPFD